MTEGKTEAKPRKLVPTSQPISVLPTDIACIYTHIHPVLILTIYYACFPYLVADPVSVLSKALAPLAHLQITYCVVCLPQFSGSSTPPPKPPTTRKSVQFANVKSKPPSLGSRITVCSHLIPPLFHCLLVPIRAAKCVSPVQPAVISLLLCLSLSAPVLTVVLILFGAPLTTHFWHNLLCATHMSLLGVLPLFYVHGVNARMWREISGACLPFDEVWGALVGTVVGAWLGAVCATRTL